jgi:hypothetical protein
MIYRALNHRQVNTGRATYSVWSLLHETQLQILDDRVCFGLVSGR